MTTDRLDTGMKVTEAIARAAAWWDRIGRHGVKASNFNQVLIQKVHAQGRGPLLKRTDKEQDLPSGILRGLQWDELSKVEQKEIVKAWHHEQVRVPLVGQAIVDAAKTAQKQ